MQYLRLLYEQAAITPASKINLDARNTQDPLSSSGFPKRCYWSTKRPPDFFLEGTSYDSTIVVLWRLGVSRCLQQSQDTHTSTTKHDTWIFMGTYMPGTHVRTQNALRRPKAPRSLSMPSAVSRHAYEYNQARHMDFYRYIHAWHTCTHTKCTP